MDEVGLREMRQDASGVVRRVEAGETVVITVNGRPAAEMRPLARRQWCRWDDVRDLFDGPGDPAWDADRSRLDTALRDPFADLRPPSPSA